MAYDNVTSRADVSASIPEDVGQEITKQAEESSAVFGLFQRVDLASSQQRVPVLSALPIVYWVNGDTGLKQTTELAWKNKYLNVEELAAILPIPDAVAEDMEFDIWGRAKPLISEAVGRQVDATVFFDDASGGLNFPDGIAASALAAGNTVTRGTADPGEGGIAEDINQVMGTVEDDGFDVNGFVTDRRYRKYLRGARATDGQKLLDVNTQTLEGEPVVYAMRGLWPSASGSAELFAGDWDQFILGVRRDITFELFKEGVIQDNTGAIIYNLMQQDMTALRVTFRMAWQVANPTTRERPDVDGEAPAARYPVGYVAKP
jgi:HK97 family phage major capsid protein